MSDVREAPLIAVVGSDGSGKSTVGDALLAWLQEGRRAELCHLGKQTGNIGRAIGRWPLFGRRLETKLIKQADTAKHAGGPGLATAMAIFLFSMRRVRRFRRMLRLRRQGVTILTDRFPQNEVAGPMDGLGLDQLDHASFLVRLLARRERQLYDSMVRHRPDLVIRLTVDLATAVARKPDHRATSLQIKIADLAKLTFGGARIVDIDATAPLEQVLDRAKQAIRPLLGPIDAPDI